MLPNEGAGLGAFFFQNSDVSRAGRGVAESNGQIALPAFITDSAYGAAFESTQKLGFAPGK